MKVVFDTQLWLRATVNPDSLAHKIIYKQAEQIAFVYSNETLAEIEDVLSRPKLQAKFPVLTDDVRHRAVTRTKEYGQWVGLDHPIPKIVRDPKDDIFLATALAGKADYLVSEDQDLLVLQQHHDTQIVDLPAFWKVLQSLL